jgi:hypothetical protein
MQASLKTHTVTLNVIVFNGGILSLAPAEIRAPPFERHSNFFANYPIQLARVFSAPSPALMTAMAL